MTICISFLRHECYRQLQYLRASERRLTKKGGQIYYQAEINLSYSIGNHRSSKTALRPIASLRGRAAIGRNISRGPLVDRFPAKIRPSHPGTYHVMGPKDMYRPPSSVGHGNMPVIHRSRSTCLESARMFSIVNWSSAS